MKRFAIGIIWAVCGYVLSAMAGYLLIDAFSSNTHDKGMEAAMTSIFFLGPIGGLIAFAIGFARTKPRSHQ